MLRAVTSDSALDGEWAVLGARLRAAVPDEYAEIMARLGALADAKELEMRAWREGNVPTRILLRPPRHRETR